MIDVDPLHEDRLDEASAANDCNTVFIIQALQVGTMALVLSKSKFNVHELPHAAACARLVSTL